ncbi:Clp protease ClpP [Paracoccus sp. MC1854]|uniref:head maturation protease, ClpP-related n=1 Tax=Paracoccus sp. MC1854 TaxID=2760306 RepID=UPI0015FF1855|nr:head maturation protease, ClpP-related [Paracoccus sp. MC1854]MBB1493310.1 Clp protease ClpP [Paracoccus sp. MC1854]
MTLRSAPPISLSRPPRVQAYEPDPGLLDRWQAGLRTTDASAANVISMLDVIGADGWTGEGVTARHIAATLRSITADEITVDLNSPGGDFFEGVAIYNLLRQDPRRVTVRILGLAASAASVIAMAGDEVQIGRAGFLMVHNAWVVAVGNRHDMAAAAETMVPFDAAMAEVYAAKAGVDPAQAGAWMDAETWFTGTQAIDAELADRFLAADVIETETSGSGPSALKRIDSLLAKQNIPRSERRALLADLRGTPGAAASVMPRADDDWAALARSLLQTLT